MEDLLLGIVADPHDEDRYLVLADWLEEYDDPRRAELLRLHRRLLATCCEPDAHPGRTAWQARIVELLAEGVRPCVPQRTVDLGGGVGMTFNFIPPGTFLMGSPEGEDGRSDAEVRHRVDLERGLYLGMHPVTQAQWVAVMGNNPSRFGGDSKPVEQISHEDCIAFCTGLCQRTGHRFRLPTEAEWEYSCRAGTTTPFHFGQVITPDQANFASRRPHFGPKVGAEGHTTPVGSFPPNGWGLFDMHGNVFEICDGCYDGYPAGDQQDPLDANEHRDLPLRGGAWYARMSACRSADRWCSSGFRYEFEGCRVVLCPDDKGP